MEKELRVLLLEDVDADALLIERELGGLKVPFSLKRVEDRQGFLTEIDSFPPDLILADYSLPTFDGLSALGITREKAPDVPFIFVSGALGEELAIEVLKQGATDYVLKERLSRLGPAVTRALREVEERREKKSLEEQLLHSQKMEAIGRLAGGVAHDFNNILTAIMGYAEILKLRMSDTNPLASNVDQIIHASEKAANLTQSLLALSRKKVVDPQPVDLKEVVKAMQKLLLRLIGEDIELRTVVGDQRMTIMADRSQIEQVLLNLATNARDAMPNGGVLTVKVETAELNRRQVKAGGGEPGSYARITFTDTGVGMDKGTLARVYEPFFTTKDQGKGTGLGLSMVYGIVKQHNGWINVQSKVGKGTAFEIYIRTAEMEAVNVLDVIRVIPKGGDETILLAEDDGNVRHMMKEALESFGYQVIEAVNGEEAVSKFDEHRDCVSLIVMDVVMPGQSGKEAYDRIVRMKPGVKSIFTSGYTADVIDQKGGAACGVPFLTKPVMPAQLLREVREVLDR